MTATININPSGDLEAMAQSVLADLGLDVPTAINIFLTQVVEKKTLPLEIAETKTVQKKIPCSELFGCMEIWMSDDFDAPLDFVGSPERKPKMSRSEVFGCMRGKFNIPDDFDAPIEDFKEYME